MKTTILEGQPMTTLMMDAQDALKDANESPPVPVGTFEYACEVDDETLCVHQVHEVDYTRGGLCLPVLLVFGQIAFEEMIAIARYYGDQEGNEPDDAMFYEGDARLDAEVIRTVLSRVSYDRVKYVELPEGEGSFTLDWEAGITPVTVWEL
jgi:hypothetical protein